MTDAFGTRLLSIAITPHTAADRDRLRHGLAALQAVVPTIGVTLRPLTDEVVIAGIGEMHLEMIIDRLKREFGVESRVGRPQVAYKETVTRSSDGESKYSQEMGGRRHYAHVKIHLYPGTRGSGYVFLDAAAGAIPKQFIQPIEQGIRGTLPLGVLAGHPMDDVRVVLYDGSYHAAYSSDLAFRLAGAIAFRDAAANAHPALLEPVMRVQVALPADQMHDAMTDLTSRGGRIQSREHRAGTQVVVAFVPLSEMFGYAATLRDRSGGRGRLEMQLERYRLTEPLDNRDEDALAGVPRSPVAPRRNPGVALPEPIFDDPDD
ncbi:MAG: hypothetical protein ABI818_06105 [Acidobacteriota bacterium]